MKAIKISQNKENLVVAIKLMIVTDSNALKEHILEFQKCNLIDHPNVMKNYNSIYDEENEFFFIISEFCEKGNLANYYKKNKLTYKEILQICIQITEGVSALHQINVIHSDLKPQNILIGDNFQIKICDLGFSKQIHAGNSVTSLKGGSLDYMAPEQTEGKLCKESDIFAVGCIFCFLCNVNISGFNMVNIKKGRFPLIENNQYEQLISLAFKMMQLETKKRIPLKESVSYLKQFQSDKKNIQYDIKEYQNGDKYEGQLKNGLKNGQGTYYFCKSGKYQGNFINDKKEGYGIRQFNNGDTYEGEFKNDLIHGKGICSYKDGGRHEGEYVNGLREGYGKYYFQNGDIYEGNYKNGLKNGKGTFYYNDGNKYEGDFLNDKREGSGIFYMKDGDRYEGQFKDDLMNGQGIYFYKQCGRYEGEFLYGKKHGQGIEFFKNEEKFDGFYQNGLRNGKGTFYYNDGGKYEGQWINDQKEGYGIIFWKDGGKFEGNFKSGLMNGIGNCYYSDGTKMYEGAIVDDKREGYGIEYKTDGDRYEGYFKNNKFHGEGKYYYKNGSKKEGDWIDGNLQIERQINNKFGYGCVACGQCNKCSIF
ncbi:hypothetical protein ABPG72_020430 [Tetrahymena utriculariae]